METPQNVNRPMTLREWGLLSAIGLVWGGAFFFVAVALQGLQPLSIGAVRMTVAGLLLTSILYAIGGRLPLHRQALAWYFVMALINSLMPLFLLAWAQKSITGGHNAILNATGPFMTLFVAHFLTQEEKLDWRRVLGTLIGLTGVVVMIGLDAIKGVSLTVIAQFASLTATLCFAFGTVFGRRFRTLGVPPLAATAGTLSASACLFIPMAIVFEQPWAGPIPGVTPLAAAIGAGVISTALGHYLFFRLLSSAGANNVALVSLLTPVSAMALGVFILGEHVEWRHLAGMATIAAGLLFVDGRLLKRLRALRSA